MTIWKRLCVGLLAAMSALTANAALTSADWQSAGDGLLTKDSATGFEWLDWSVTRGLTVGQALAAHQDFRVASAAEFNQLVIHAGMNNSTQYEAATFSAASTFIALVNTAGNTCYVNWACGLYDAGGGNTHLVNIGAYGGKGFAGDGFGNYAQGWASSSYGVLLVRNAVAPVPEPEVYAMLMAGLGLLGFMSRRKKAHAAA